MFWGRRQGNPIKYPFIFVFFALAFQDILNAGAQSKTNVQGRLDIALFSRYEYLIKRNVILCFLADKTCWINIIWIEGCPFGCMMVVGKTPLIPGRAFMHHLNQPSLKPLQFHQVVEIASSVWPASCFSANWISKYVAEGAGFFFLSVLSYDQVIDTGILRFVSNGSIYKLHQSHRFLFSWRIYQEERKKSSVYTFRLITGIMNVIQ